MTAQTHRATVLVVDDTPDNILILSAALEDEYRVRAATSGPSALASVQRSPPDIILLDIMMPNMDGYEVCQVLKADPLTRRIPVIFVTAMTEFESERRGFELGAVDYITKPVMPAIVRLRVRNQLALHDQRRALEFEVQARTRELEQANTALANEALARAKAMERAEYLFNYDLLTGLPNRRQFVERLERLVDHAPADGAGFALFGVGLDRFSVVKTSLGGTVSDQLLFQTGRRLQQQLRSGDLIARTGGEEFAALVPRHAGKGLTAEIDELLSQVLNELVKPFELVSGSAEIGVSVAYALFPEDAGSAGELFRRMEMALENVKLSGGGRVQHYAREVEKVAGVSFAMEARIRDALKGQVFVPHYQPKVHGGSGRVVGAEALVRWPVADGVMISPAEFIPVAEHRGLIDALDRFMLEATCRQIAKWGHWHPGFRIAVNLSAAAFQSPGLVPMIRGVLERTGAGATHLELEITEHALITNLDIAIDKLAALRDMGVHIALDDFGTGYSSMSYLQRLPLDVLKVDQCFVRDIGKDRHAAAIVRAIMTMARSLDLDIVAEGVETPEQLAFITGLDGEALIQGWVYSPAVPAEQFDALMERGTIGPVGRVST